MMAKLDISSVLRMKSGECIPILGYGVYQTHVSVAAQVTQYAIHSGYRHVDSASAYRNEQPVCEGMLAAGIPRNKLFFTSKIPPKKMNYKDAKACIDESLRLTGLDFIDLYLLHSPYGKKEGRLGAWKALVESVQEGKVKSIGVSNYGLLTKISVHHLEELENWQKQQVDAASAGILSVNQIELHPWLARQDIVDWCNNRNVVVEAYSPLVRGTRMDDPLLFPLVKKHNKTAAQILLRWGLQKGFVVLPKSVTLSRIDENRDVFDFELSEGDMKDLETNQYQPCTWDPTTASLSE